MVLRNANSSSHSVVRRSAIRTLAVFLWASSIYHHYSSVGVHVCGFSSPSLSLSKLSSQRQLTRIPSYQQKTSGKNTAVAVEFWRRKPRRNNNNIGITVPFSTFDDFEEFKSSESFSSSSELDDDLYAELRARQSMLAKRQRQQKQQQKQSSDTSNTDSPSSPRETINTSNTSNASKTKLQPLQKQRLISNWKTAKCQSTINIVLNDWIRRLAIYEWPFAVVGGSSGSLFLVDLSVSSRGESSSSSSTANTDNAEPRDGVLDCVPNAHLAQIQPLMEDYEFYQEDEDDDDMRVAEAMEDLYGPYDGGGVIALAVWKDTVVSAGREGGVRVFTIAMEEQEIQEQKQDFERTGDSKRERKKLKLKNEGIITGLSSTLVTSLAFDDSGTLWVGGHDGIIRGYDHDEDQRRLNTTSPYVKIDTNSLLEKKRKQQKDRAEAQKEEESKTLKSKIMSLSISNELGCGVAGSTSGHSFLFSLEDGEVLTKWRPFGKWGGISNGGEGGQWKREYVRSVAIVKNENSSAMNGKEEAVWSVICGGSEGTMYQRRLNVDSYTGFVSERKPLVDEYPSTGRLSNRGSRSEKSSYSLSTNMKEQYPIVGRMEPSHSGQVVALTSPYTGILVSGSQDGTIRVWDCSSPPPPTSSNGKQTKPTRDINTPEWEVDDDDDDDDYQQSPKCLYSLTGYKVWLGSIWTDLTTLVSDGADNTIVVHDFSASSSSSND